MAARIRPGERQVIATARGQIVPTRTRSLRGDGKPLNERERPGRGYGMKQALEPVCGESRREVVNTCGRNVSRTWDVLERVDAPGDVAKRVETLAVRPTPERVRAGEESEGTLKRSPSTRE